MAEEMATFKQSTSYPSPFQPCLCAAESGWKKAWKPGEILESITERCV